MLLYRVIQALESKDVEYAIVGGFAVALHGAVRGTVDLDLVLRLTRKNFVAAESAMQTLGLEARLPVKAAEVYEFREEYIQNRSLIAWSFSNPRKPSEVVDFVITHDLKALRTTKIRSGSLTLNVLELDDLIGMKRESGRPQDLEDIRALEEIRRRNRG